HRLDPSRVNGAPLLGLNGIVVKSHGGADANGFASAIRVATNLARSDFRAEIDRNLKRLTATAAAIKSGDGQGPGADAQGVAE
ncbi:MAG: phosphate acyltransferase, partial [Caulobacter sp.]